MSDRGVSDYDMPNRTWPPRNDASGIPDASLAALLESGTPAADTPAALRHVADVLAALQAEPAADEAAGQATAIAEFRNRVGVPKQPARSRWRRPAVLTPPPLLRSRVGAAATAVVVGLGGLAAAAYAGALPASAQLVAHNTIGAPVPKQHDGGATGRHGTPVGPNASGHAAFGLCTAYVHGKEAGSEATKSVAFRALEKAAGGAANVPAYCEGVLHPGASNARHPDGRPDETVKPHPTGKPPHP